jgi:hypothetical protein
MSCLFNSLSTFVSVSPEKLREDICNFIEANSKALLPGLDEKVLLGSDLKKYVAAMRQPGTWGGAIEIQAFCQMYNAEVRVTNIRGSDAPRRKHVQVTTRNGRVIVLQSPLTSPPSLSTVGEENKETATPPPGFPDADAQAPGNEMVFVKSTSEGTGGTQNPEEANRTRTAAVEPNNPVLKVRISWNGSHYEPIP